MVRPLYGIISCLTYKLFSKAKLRLFAVEACVRTMSDKEILSPPEAVRGMTRLDRELFSKDIEVPFVVIPNSMLSKAKPILHQYLFKRPCLRPVLDSNTCQNLVLPIPIPDDHKLALLRPLSSINSDHSSFLKELGTLLPDKPAILTLKYPNWYANEVLRAVIPANLESVSSFSAIGHIVHVNLKAELSEFRQVIGEVLLDKVASAKTVVNKEASIDSEFRTFRMELLAGDPNTVAEIRENGFRFRIDLANVYWNPRLSTEHSRLVARFSPNDIVYDACCGVGPFAIPAARKGCKVLANDLNPSAVEAVQWAAKANRVTLAEEPYCMDGRTFLSEKAAAHLASQPSGWTGQVHVVANLPAGSLMLLPSLVPLVKAASDNVKLFAHIYVFAYAEGPDPHPDPQDAVSIVREALTSEYTANIDESVFVRNVAPRKDMFRVSLALTAMRSFTTISSSISSSQDEEVGEEDRPIQNKQSEECETEEQGESICRPSEKRKASSSPVSVSSRLRSYSPNFSANS